MNETIKTMISQFCVTTNRLVAMIGAHDFIYSNKENYFAFKFKLCRKANYCKLIYNEGPDLYTMEFYKAVKSGLVYTYKKVKVIDGLYFDMLRETFEEYTGLYIVL